MMRLRVVCGFGDVMAIFWFSTRFSKVDFPTLGAPIILMRPDLNGCVRLIPASVTARQVKSKPLFELCLSRYLQSSIPELGRPRGSIRHSAMTRRASYPLLLHLAQPIGIRARMKRPATHFALPAVLGSASDKWWKAIFAPRKIKPFTL